MLVPCLPLLLLAESSASVPALRVRRGPSSVCRLTLNLNNSACLMPAMPSFDSFLATTHSAFIPGSVPRFMRLVAPSRMVACLPTPTTVTRPSCWTRRSWQRSVRCHHPRCGALCCPLQGPDTARKTCGRSHPALANRLQMCLVQHASASALVCVFGNGWRVGLGCCRPIETS
jgi:hypothetical protein